MVHIFYKGISLKEVHTFYKSISLKEVLIFYKGISLKEIHIFYKGVSLKEVHTFYKSISLKEVLIFYKGISLKEIHIFYKDISLKEVDTFYKGVSLKVNLRDCKCTAGIHTYLLWCHSSACQSKELLWKRYEIKYFLFDYGLTVRKTLSFNLDLAIGERKLWIQISYRPREKWAPPGYSYQKHTTWVVFPWTKPV